MNRITLIEWLNANTDEKSEMLHNNVLLTATSHQVLSWALLFKDCGAIISDKTLEIAYRRHVVAQPLDHEAASEDKFNKMMSCYSILSHTEES